MIHINSFLFYQHNPKLLGASKPQKLLLLFLVMINQPSSFKTLLETKIFFCTSTEIYTKVACLNSIF